MALEPCANLQCNLNYSSGLQSVQNSFPKYAAGILSLFQAFPSFPPSGSCVASHGASHLPPPPLKSEVRRAWGPGGHGRGR